MASRIRRGLGTLQGVTDKRAARQNLGLEDGAGSFVNADQLDGREGGGYAYNEQLANGADLNQVSMQSGMWSGVNLANAPSGSRTYAAVLIERLSNDWVIQRYTEIADSPRQWVRSYYSGTSWSGWVEVITNVVEQQIGVGQTWQVPSRSAGVSYTNTTGKPIAVSLRTNGTVDSRLYVDGVTVADESSSSADSSLFAIVPPGSTYSFDGGSSLLELR